MPEVKLIDGNRLAELFESAAERGAGVLATVYRDAAYLARTAQTIEPEVRHGRWEEIGGYEPENHGFACSVCDFATMVKSRFCPNCGARMDGGADNG